MEPYLIITELNDFIFCPKSIYFHHLYGGYSARLYKQRPQIVGTINHEKIDNKTYSSRKTILQGLEVFSETYRLCGKIDLYDAKAKTLVERKTTIKKIYDGYKYQLWAQYFCLVEMGYPVEHLALHSLTDNKRYYLEIPRAAVHQAEFEALLKKIRAFDPHQPFFTQNPEKCKNCIYAPLCESRTDIPKAKSSSCHALTT